MSNKIREFINTKNQMLIAGSKYKEDIYSMFIIYTMIHFNKGQFAIINNNNLFISTLDELGIKYKIDEDSILIGDRIYFIVKDERRMQGMTFDSALIENPTSCPENTFMNLYARMWGMDDKIGKIFCIEDNQTDNWFQWEYIDKAIENQYMIID